MPNRPPSYCVVAGCPVRVDRPGRCAAHDTTHETQRNRDRPNIDVRRWYRTERWSWLRRQVLADALYACAACGVITTRLQIDHIRPHGGDPALFWNRANLQALCARCHQLKTARGE